MSEDAKNDGEQLLDAQPLIGMIERYRPGTVREARAWFAEHLASLPAPPEINNG